MADQVNPPVSTGARLAIVPGRQLWQHEQREARNLGCALEVKTTDDGIAYARLTPVMPKARHAFRTAAIEAGATGCDSVEAGQPYRHATEAHAALSAAIRPVTVLTEGVAVDFRLRVCLRMALGTVYYGQRRLDRRVVLQGIARGLRRRWDWAVALPGDRFYIPIADALIEVHSGTTDRRYIKALGREHLDRDGEAAWHSVRPHHTFTTGATLERA